MDPPGTPEFVEGATVVDWARAVVVGKADVILGPVDDVSSPSSPNSAIPPKTTRATTITPRPMRSPRCLAGGSPLGAGGSPTLVGASLAVAGMILPAFAGGSPSIC